MVSNTSMKMTSYKDKKREVPIGDRNLFGKSLLNMELQTLNIVKRIIPWEAQNVND